jgi:hypothetical protein
MMLKISDYRKHADLTIHWKALDHMFSNSLIFRDNMHFLTFSQKTSVFKNLMDNILGLKLSRYLNSRFDRRKFHGLH